MADAELQLELPARAENVIVVRQAVAGVGDALGLPEQRIDDLKTVVTEACNNVVVHAYEDGEDGPMIVSAGADDRTVSVTVSDRGKGFQPRASEDGGTLGIGLPLIASLSDSFEITGGGAGEGSRTVARFALRASEDGAGDGGAARSDVAEELELAISPGELVRPVLARVIGALAARAEFSFERLSDTVLLGDAVSAHPGDDFTRGKVEIKISDGDGNLALRIGPLVEGGGERVLSQMDLPGGDGSLRALASRMEVTRGDGDDAGAEYLEVEVSN